MKKNFRGRRIKIYFNEAEDLIGANFNDANLKGINKKFNKTILKKAIFKNSQCGLRRHWLFLLFLILLVLSAVSGAISSLAGIFILMSFTNKANELFKTISIVGVLLSLLILLIQTIRQGFLIGIGSGVIALFPALIVCYILPQKVGEAGNIGVAFLIGTVAVTLTAISLAATAFSTTGVIATLGVVPIAVAGTLTTAAVVAVKIPKPEAIPTTLIVSAMGNYIALRSLAGDPNFAWIRSFAVAFAAWRGTSFQGADLTDTNFTEANLKNTDFRGANITRACWYKVKGLELARLGGTILINPVVRDLLINKKGKANQSLVGLNLKGANLVGADLINADLTGSDLSNATLEGACLKGAILIGVNLRGANLIGADFSHANLKEVDLTEANLQEARLEWANLTKSQAIDTNFRQAHLTGACLEAWNIDSTTKLDKVDCRYFYLLEHPHPITGDKERRPHDPDKIFEPGDFEKLYKKIMNTVQILLRNGINKEAFAVAFQKLMEENPEITPDSIQGVEKKDNDVLLTLQVPEGTDKAKIERDFNEPYKLEAQKQAALLEAEVRHSREMKEVTMTLASNLSNLLSNLTIIASGETTTMTNNNPSITSGAGSFINLGEGNSMAMTDSNFLSEISGNVTNAVNQLPTAPEPEKPGIKELLTQLQTLIEAETNLTDKNKEKALKQVKALAEAAQNPKEPEKQDLADTAITMLKGLITGLPSAATLVEACNKLLPAIASLLGLG